MNRAQKILRYVASCKTPADFRAIVRTVQPGASQSTRCLISAQLNQLTKANKLKRTGKPMAYLYAATATTLIDGRRFHPDGKPRKKARRPKKPTVRPERSAAKSKCKPATKHRAKPTAAQNFVITAPSRRGASRDAKAEQSARIAADVATFLKRGGRIQKLAWGAASNPQSDMQRRNSERAAGRKRAQQQRTAVDLDDDYDTDSDDALAA